MQKKFEMLNQIIDSTLEKYKGGSRFFNALDELIRNNNYLLGQMLKYVKDNYMFDYVIVSGKFGMKFKEFCKIVDKNFAKKIVMVNGNLRKTTSKIKFLTKQNINGKELIFIDDSLYSGKTKCKITEALGLKDAKLKETIVFYDGMRKKEADSFYRYYKEENTKVFEAKKEVEAIVHFIRNYYKENNLGGAIIGISGGKDSAVVSALFTKALGKENVIGLTMPCHSNCNDKKDAEVISNHFGFKLYNFDLTSCYDGFKENINSLDITADTTNSDINLKPRLRMATLYYMAALFSAKNKKTYLVAGTGNKCEIYVGYFTKGGDGMSDINVLANYTVSEVIKLGQYLKVPKEILYKTPSDGLSMLTDEEKLGVTYKEIENYIIGNSISEKSKSLIKSMYDNNRHKEGIIVYKKGDK